MVEFFEDYYYNNRKQAWQDERKKTGHVRLPKTGDPFIDRWEEQLAQGVSPDLTETLLPEAREKMQMRMRAVTEAQKAREAAELQEKTKQFFTQGKDAASMYLEEFSDDYRGQ